MNANITYYALTKHHATTISHRLLAQRMNYEPETVDEPTLVEAARNQGVSLFPRNHQGLTDFMAEAHKIGGLALDRALVILQHENMG